MEKEKKKERSPKHAAFVVDNSSVLPCRFITSMKLTSQFIPIVTSDEDRAVKALGGGRAVLFVCWQ